MSRNLKTLSLALVAVFALGAVEASAAQADSHHLVVPSTPAVITGEQHETTVFRVTEGDHKLDCEKGIYRGTVSANNNKTITLAPEYEKCFVDGTLSATVTVNHCALVLYAVTNAEGHAETEIECETDNEITIQYSVLGSSCSIHVGPQKLTGITYTETTNMATGKLNVTVDLTLSEIKYKETGSGMCPATTTRSDGSIFGGVTLQAYKVIGTACPPKETETTTPKTKLGACQGEVQNLELGATQ